MEAPQDDDTEGFSVSSHDLHVPTDDLRPLQETPDLAGDYCGPVSTPAVFTATMDFKQPTEGASLSDQPEKEICLYETERSHREVEINYPHYMKSRDLATRTNLEYYYVRSYCDNDLIPRGFSHMTAHPFQVLYNQYRNKQGGNKPTDFQTLSQPTPGERALMLGWESNRRKVKDSHPLPSKTKAMATDSAITHAFPPSRVQLTRSRTAGTEGLADSRGLVYSGRHGGRHIFNQNMNFSWMSRDRMDFNADLFPKRLQNEEYFAQTLKQQVPRKSTNYLNFMTRKKRSAKGQRRVKREDQNSTLPDIHVKPTTLTELKLADLKRQRHLTHSVSKPPNSRLSLGFRDHNRQHYSNFVTSQDQDKSFSERCIICIPQMAMSASGGLGLEPGPANTT